MSEPAEPAQGALGDARARPGRSTWSDEATRASLLLLADALREASGFGVVTIGVADDQGTCETVAVSGDTAAQAGLLGTRVPVAVYEELLARGTRTGQVTFVRGLEVADELTDVQWTRDGSTGSTGSDGSAGSTGPEAQGWGARDWLAAAVRDDDETLVGVVQLDLPRDGRRPDAAGLAEVDRRCATAAGAVRASRDGAKLAVRARMALTARDVVRSSSGRRSISAILARTHAAVIEGFRARSLFVQLFDEQGGARLSTVYRADGEETTVPRDLVDLAERDSRTAWARQEVVVVDRATPGAGWLSEQESRRLLGFLDPLGVASILFAPLGVGPTCLGSLTLTRLPGDPTWTDEECQAALDIGHDLGHAIVSARAQQRGQDLLDELRELDAYKSNLIATVSHELRNPLTAVAGHLEILRSMRDELPDSTERSLVAMERGTRRLERIIEDLLTFSKVGDPGRVFHPAVIDLREVVRDVRELHDLPARRRRQRVEVTMPDEPVPVHGLTGDLDTVVSNLVGNALKYSAEGKVVRVVLEQDAREVSLTCTDQGLGISETDQRAVFGEFFRSEDPAVRRQGGTGLGLAIVGRIVKRHRGRVSVSSQVGVGSTFRVQLPSVAEFERAAAEAALEAELLEQARGARDTEDPEEYDAGPSRSA